MRRELRGHERRVCARRDNLKCAQRSLVCQLACYMIVRWAPPQDVATANFSFSSEGQLSRARVRGGERQTERNNFIFGALETLLSPSVI